MSVDAQRLHQKADRIRGERAARRSAPVTRPYDAERDGEPSESPDDGATVGSSPVEDAEDRIARVEGLSTFRSVDEMGGLGDPGPTGFNSQVERLGAELAQQVDSRVQDWLADARDEFGNVTQTKPQSFMFGALFGGLILALGVLLGGRTRFR